MELEIQDPYERGFIDGMAKQRESRVQQMVEGYAKLRELSNEEILEYADAFGADMGNTYEFGHGQFIAVIRAILKKAQEK